jgi:hypothetical protein
MVRHRQFGASTHSWYPDSLPRQLPFVDHATFNAFSTFSLSSACFTTSIISLT